MKTAITRLTLQHFRCFPQFTLTPDSGVNLISGANGLGKTSVLEALYFLSYGRSFRTAQLDRIIQQDQQGFTIFCEFCHRQKTHQLGVSRHKQHPAKMRLDGEDISSHALIAQQLPMLIMNPESFRFFTDGAKGRRQILDWGVFFAESQFMQAWQKANRILQQRNQALKMQQPYSVIAPWDQQFVEMAEVIDEARSRYVAVWVEALKSLLGDFWSAHQLSMSYVRGWSKEKALLPLLESHYAQDRAQGFTQYGPHRADIRLRAKGIVAQDHLSRGQQKRLIYALKLAQGKVLKEASGQNVIYLLDDIRSELDQDNFQQLLTSVVSQDAQVFLTSIDDNEIPEVQRSVLLGLGS